MILKPNPREIPALRVTLKVASECSDLDVVFMPDDNRVLLRDANNHDIKILITTDQAYQLAKNIKDRIKDE